MAKLFLLHSDSIEALVVSDGPNSDNVDPATYDPEVEAKVMRVRDDRPMGTIIGVNLAGEAPKVVMFKDDDPESARRLASNVRRSIGEYTTARNLKAADLRRFAERDDTIFLVTVGKSDEETTGAYYRLDNLDNITDCKVLDADGNPAEPGFYERKDDKPIIHAARTFEIGEGGTINGLCAEAEDGAVFSGRPSSGKPS